MRCGLVLTPYFTPTKHSNHKTKIHSPKNFPNPTETHIQSDKATYKSLKTYKKNLELNKLRRIQILQTQKTRIEITKNLQRDYPNKEKTHIHI